MPIEEATNTNVIGFGFTRSGLKPTMKEIKENEITVLISSSVERFSSIFNFSPSPWSWSYGSWIYNYLCNQFLSPLKLWVRNSARQGVLDTTLCDKVCHWLAAGRWFSPGTPVSSIDKTECHDITNYCWKWR